jgi:flavin-dependent dehydrogenase
MKILVVGGGTAGLISAIILKKRLNIELDIVYSKNIPIVGVGEGSTEHFNEFMKIAGIDFRTIIKKCGATFKSGIMFEGWSENPYLHSVGGNYTTKVGQYPLVFGNLLSKDANIISSKLTWENKIEQHYIDSNATTPYNQYHFDTFKLNSFLIEFAKNIGINVFEDDIVNVVIKENGFIDYIEGETKKYNYDFYIDSTGFKRLLIEKLGAKWVSFGKQLKMKSAITFQTPDEENYNLWTLAKALDYGWMFRIPTWGRYGNGYIYDSDYIGEEDAKKEVQKLFNFDVEIGRRFSFDPGTLDRPWINNCVAVGLSASFVEPLEATSIGTTIQQTFLLMHRLANYNQKSIDSYNKSYSQIMDNIKDFLILHYITDKKTSAFWEDVSKIELTDSLSNNLEMWSTRLPIREDFSNLSEYILFTENNFIAVLHGLNMYNSDLLKNEYMMINKDIRNYGETLLNQEYLNEEKSKTLTHKEYISLIRNIY